MPPSSKAWQSARFAYQPRGGPIAEGALPFLPLDLQYNHKRLTVAALLDSGASVNVLPYRVGLQLGVDWDAQGQTVVLGGNLAAAPAKGCW